MLVGSGLVIDGESVPLDAQQRLRIDFIGPLGTVPVIPLRDVLFSVKGVRPLEVILDGAIVIVGDVTRGQHDYHVTAFANRLFQAADSRGRTDVRSGGACERCSPRSPMGLDYDALVVDRTAAIGRRRDCLERRVCQAESVLGCC